MIPRLKVSKIIFKRNVCSFIAFQSLILWVERDDLRTNTPECFKSNFKDVTVIVDCFEIYRVVGCNFFNMEI